MVPYIGDFSEDATVYIPFNTFDSNDPAASATITNLADADIKVHKDGSVTDIVTDGATVAIDFDGVTGNHLITVDTSVHADYATGSDYMVRIEGTTVDAATVNAWVAQFSIENRHAAGALRPATAGRTLVVDAAGLADANMVKAGPTGSGTAQTARDLGQGIPNAVPGASGGLLIAGTNSAATSFTAGITISNASGTGLDISSGVNAAGMLVVGSGSGAGIDVQGGSGGDGISALGNGGQHGIYAQGNTAGAGMYLAGGGPGLSANGGGNNPSDGFISVLGTGGVDIRGDITGDITGLVSGTVAGVTPAAAGAQMDLVDAPNATAVTAIQNGLATPTNITAGTIATVTNLTNAPTSGDLTATMKTSVQTAVDAAIDTTDAEPGQGAPGATISLRAKIGYLYKAWRNQSWQTATQYSLYNDAADTVDHKATVSDDATTAKKGEVVTGP